MGEDFGKTIARIASQRLQIIMGQREKYVEAWIAEHGHLPSAMELHEQVDGTTIVRLRSKSDG